MTHWSGKYLHLPWTEKCDCFGWFRTIQLEEFGRDVPGIVSIDHRHLALGASRAMARDIRRTFGWSPTDFPQDGDAAFLSQRCRPHHIGTVAVIGKSLYILHALEGAGVVLSDLLTLRVNNWRVAGYWTYGN